MSASMFYEYSSHLYNSRETVVDRRGRMEREGKKRGIKTNGARAADVVPRAVDPVRRRGKP